MRNVYMSNKSRKMRVLLTNMNVVNGSSKLFLEIPKWAYITSRSPFTGARQITFNRRKKRCARNVSNYH